MSEPDPMRLLEATQQHLANLLARESFPTPEDNADLAAFFGLAYMHGCAIMGEACGLDGALWIAKGREIVTARFRERTRPQIILPPGFRRG